MVTFGAITLNVSYSAPAQAVVCPGATLALGVTTTGGGGTQGYTWFNNGIQVGTGSPFVTSIFAGDSFTVAVTDACNTTAVVSAPYVPVFETLVGGTISGDLTALSNDPSAATPGIGTYTLTGQTAGSTISWLVSTSPTGPWSTLAGSTATELIDFNGVTGTWYVASQITSAAGCTAMSNVLAVQAGVANDLPCNAYPLAMGNQAGFSWTTAGATVDGSEVAPPANGCNVQTGWCNSTLDATVWFSLVAPASGHVSIQAPAYDDQLAIYSATNCADYSPSH